MLDQPIDRLFDWRHIYPDNRQIGIEIEMEGEGLEFDLYHAPRWTRERDGSLRGSSCEFKLTSPIIIEDVRSEIECIQRAADAGGAQFNPSLRCAVHIHMNCQNMTEIQVVNLITLFLVFEEVLTNWCGEERAGNLFCLRSKDAEGFLYNLSQGCFRGKLDGICNDSVRYAALNVASLQKYGTLEWRTMGTPKDLTRIITWIDILYAIKQAALKFKEPSDIVQSFSSDGMEGFMRSIVGDYVNVLLCENYEDKMHEGIRQAQDLAIAITMGKEHRKRLRENKKSGKKKEMERNVEYIPGEMVRVVEDEIVPAWPRWNANIIREQGQNQLAEPPPRLLPANTGRLERPPRRRR